MSDRIKPLLGALVAGYIVNLVLVTYVYLPVAAEDIRIGSGGEALMPGWLALGIFSVVVILFFDWVNQSLGNPMKSALIIAVSQILLVDVYYVLLGNREITTAVVSAVVLLGGYCTIGFVYGKLSDG